MSSFPLTKSYFSRWLLHHQPVINEWILGVPAPSITIFSDGPNPPIGGRGILGPLLSELFFMAYLGAKVR
jgi:hypothetical protein